MGFTLLLLALSLSFRLSSGLGGAYIFLLFTNFVGFALLTTLDPETFFHSVCNFDLLCSMGFSNFTSLGNSLISTAFISGISNFTSFLCTPSCALYNSGNSGKILLQISSSTHSSCSQAVHTGILGKTTTSLCISCLSGNSIINLSIS